MPIGAGCEQGGDLRALGLGGGGEALAERLAARVDAHLAAALRIDEPRSGPTSGSSCSRRSRISTATTS